MFCSECGKKNPSGASFCEECGNKLVSNTGKQVSIKKPSKPISKKKKILIGVISSAALLLFICYFVLSNMFSPKTIAKDYFEAVINADMDKLYGYLSLDDKGFTSKKLFKKVSNFKKTKVLNYSVSSENKSSDGLTSTVTINYTLSGESTANTATIHLIKDKSNKFLIFDNWKVADENSSLREKLKVEAPKDSTVKFEDITLDKSYLSKKSSKKYDTYVIPTIITGKYNVSVTLKNGFTIENKVTVDDYQDVDLTYMSVSSKQTKELEKLIPGVLNSLYKDAMEKKSFVDIKGNYEYDSADLKDLESNYNYFMQRISSSSLTKFDVKEAEVEDANLYGNHIKVQAEISYEYETNRTFFGETITNNDSSSDSITLYFDYFDGKFKLVDFSSLPRYFY